MTDTPTRSLPEPETVRVTVRCEATCGDCLCLAPGTRSLALTGRDALVMALGRAAWEERAHLAKWESTGCRGSCQEQDDWAMVSERTDSAVAALSAFDAAQEPQDTEPSVCPGCGEDMPEYCEGCEP